MIKVKDLNMEGLCSLLYWAVYVIAHVLIGVRQRESDYREGNGATEAEIALLQP